MQELENVIKELENNNVMMLRYDIESDIDMYSQDLIVVKDIFRKYGFIVTASTNTFTEAIKYIQNRIIIVEVANTLLGTNRLNLNLKDIYISEYIKNPIKNDIWLKSIRYIVSLRNDKKSNDFFKNNLKELEENNFYIKRLKENNFNNDINIDLLLNNKFKFILKYMGTLKLLSLIKDKILFHLKSLITKKTIAIVGVDGAGKTTIIEVLKKYNTKSVYMGFKEFKFDNFYKRISGKNIFFTFLVHFMVFFENWYKYLKSILFRFQGYDVIFDRYPKIEYLISENKKLHILHSIFYKFFFPSATKEIFIKGNPLEIYKRKQEMNIDEIKIEQKKLEDIVEYIVLNKDGEFEKTINSIFRIINE